MNTYDSNHFFLYELIDKIDCIRSSMHIIVRKVYIHALSGSTATKLCHESCTFC